MIKEITKANNKFILVFTKYNKLIVDEDTLIKFNLLKAKKISQKEYNDIVAYQEFINDYNKAIKYLSRPRSVFQLRKYLVKSIYLEKIVNILIKNKYLDDEKFAKLIFDNERNIKNKGPLLIKKILKDKGIKEEIINLLEYENEEEKIIFLINKKLKSIKHKNISKTKRALYSYLIQRGFNSDIVLKLIEVEI